MTREYMSPEEGEKLKTLREGYLEATSRAAAALIEGGMSSEEFLKADAEAGRFSREIKALLGIR